MYANPSWLCEALRRVGGLMLRLADRLDAARIAATAACRPRPDEPLVAARDRILSRYY